jgi:multidrug efflux pump subunit AcrB
MMLAGFTINLLTLLAIVLAVGLVVDATWWWKCRTTPQEGERPMEAAKGARELVGPIIAMTITLAAVYTPIGIGRADRALFGNSPSPWRERSSFRA